MGCFWSHFGASWEASWTHVPKKLDFEGFGDGPGSPRQQFGFNLEAEDPSKSRLERETIDVKRKRVFGIDFLGAGTQFWIGFWTIF